MTWGNGMKYYLTLFRTIFHLSAKMPLKRSHNIQIQEILTYYTASPEYEARVFWDSMREIEGRKNTPTVEFPVGGTDFPNLF
jgi:hypothetical protein